MTDDQHASLAMSAAKDAARRTVCFEYAVPLCDSCIAYVRRIVAGALTAARTSAIAPGESHGERRTGSE